MAVHRHSRTGSYALVDDFVSRTMIRSRAFATSQTGLPVRTLAERSLFGSPPSDDRNGYGPREPLQLHENPSQRWAKWLAKVNDDVRATRVFWRQRRRKDGRMLCLIVNSFRNELPGPTSVPRAAVTTTRMARGQQIRSDSRTSTTGASSPPNEGPNTARVSRAIRIHDLPRLRATVRDES